jgi:hypothetical protein
LVQSPAQHGWPALHLAPAGIHAPQIPPAPQTFPQHIPFAMQPAPSGRQGLQKPFWHAPPQH